MPESEPASPVQTRSQRGAGQRAEVGPAAAALSGPRPTSDSRCVGEGFGKKSWEMHTQYRWRSGPSLSFKGFLIPDLSCNLFLDPRTSSPLILL